MDNSLCSNKTNAKLAFTWRPDRFFFNPFPTKPWFLRVCSLSLLKTLWEYGEMARNEPFLLFPQCFLFVWGISSIEGCRLQTHSGLEEFKICRLGKGLPIPTQ